MSSSKLELDLVPIPPGTAHTGTLIPQVEDLAERFAVHPSWFDGELPGARVALPAYDIGRTPVTNEQWAIFVADGGGRAPDGWQGRTPPQDVADHPVTHVNLHDAQAFATWAGVRLPSAAEWERAARADEHRVFPWGDEMEPSHAHYDADGTAPVGSLPAGVSPFGVLDLSGNVAEWTADQPDPATAIVKGGSWVTTVPANLRVAAVGQSGWALNRMDYIGFRVARSR
ncbi:formylglycine-generating enzyme family protein [Streptomyces sp. NPDC058701]|uniref:formylglycine-generating enzyme family protein n=1 Tax=Streptomyces sp. NPDC058701 TaxID=3346608 RepID=UPI00364E4D11